MELISQTLDTYRDRFHSGALPRLFRAPGRVNLIGEHTDYNDGYVLPAAIDREILVAATSRNDAQVNVYARDLDQWDHCRIEKPIERTSGNSWGNDVRGMVWSLLEQGYGLMGMDAVVGGNIPIGAGLSSSGAMEVALGFTLLRLSESQVEGKSLAIAAQRAENEFVGMRCGIMDMEYNSRREECETAAGYFGVYALRDVDMEAFNACAHRLSPVVRRRARHVLSENNRTLAAAAALQDGDLTTFGAMMTASHASLRNDFEVSCPELDMLVDIAMDVQGVYGARLTGAGFGGCMVALAAQEAAEDVVAAIAARYSSASGRKATSYICKASDGVSELGA